MGHKQFAIRTLRLRQAATEDILVVVTRLHDGKFKVNSKGWDEEKVILPDEIVELR